MDAHKASFGVEPICKVLEIAPSTYYAARNRQPCARVLRDAELKVEIERVYAHNRYVFGRRKVWRALNREGIAISRCRTERLMRQMGSTCGTLTTAGEAALVLRQLLRPNNTSSIVLPVSRSPLQRPYNISSVV
jgi:hypothetical protein